MGKNLTRMVDQGVIDPDAAKLLNDEVIAKVEKMTEQEVDIVIKFKLEISGDEVWSPDQDGSIF
jgi:hypothetical protein